ncbi:MAG: hypothetical protein GEU79_17340 [Acidimicrobiia bacterium]|nr:hypothetical protein [Acidimicrobiia bacterium]
MRLIIALQGNGPSVALRTGSAATSVMIHPDLVRWRYPADHNMALFSRRTKPVKLKSMDQLLELTGSGLPVFVDFWQHNNPESRQMDGIIAELADEFAGDAIIAKADITRVPDIFEKFRIKATPTFVIVVGNDSSSGFDLKWRAGGLIKKDQLLHQLESAVSKGSSG